MKNNINKKVTLNSNFNTIKKVENPQKLIEKNDSYQNNYLFYNYQTINKMNMKNQDKQENDSLMELSDRKYFIKKYKITENEIPPYQRYSDIKNNYFNKNYSVENTEKYQINPVFINKNIDYRNINFRDFKDKKTFIQNISKYKKFDEDLIKLLGFHNTEEIDELRNMWRKEKNRVAAKKSREKKSVKIKELEKRERVLSYQVVELKEAIRDYDILLYKTFTLLKGDLFEKVINKELQETNGENSEKKKLLTKITATLLKGFLGLKSGMSGGKKYFMDTQSILNFKLNTTSEIINKIIEEIKDKIKEFFKRKE